VLGLPEKAVLCSLARYLLATHFDITAAIQRLMEYGFWMKSINSKEDIERLYPISKEQQAVGVLSAV
jgi:hypothetical protein